MNNNLYDWDQDHPRIKWLVSAIVFLIALVIGMVSVRGQFGVEQPIFQLSVAAEFTPESIPGIYAYWDVRDIGYTNVDVTNFTERIQSMIVTNGNLSRRPLNTSTGLFFSTGTIGKPYTLTNTTPFLLSVGSTMFCTVKCTRPDDEIATVYGYGIDPSTDHRQLNHFSVNGAATYDSNSRWGLWVNNAGAAAILAANKDLETNTWITIAISEVAAGFVTYTNGISVGYTNTASQISGVRERMSYIGGKTGSVGEGISHISQLIFYTNVLTSTQISNLNYFAYKP